MLQTQKLETQKHGRVTLPFKVIKYIASLNEEALKACDYKLTISIVDQLCAKFSDLKRAKAGRGIPGRIFVGDTFANVIPALALIAAPIGTKYLKMAPHPGDGFKGKRNELLNTWTAIFEKLTPSKGWQRGWQSCKPTPVERTKHYTQIGRDSDVIIRTNETAGWANVTLTLDLNKLSPTAKRLVKHYRSEMKNQKANGESQQGTEVSASRTSFLMDFLAEAGHGNGVLVVPEKYLEKFKKYIKEDSFNIIHTKSSMNEITETISENWIPDTYPKGQSILQRASAYIPLSKGSANPLKNLSASSEWTQRKNNQKMSIKNACDYLNKEKRDFLVVVVPDGDAAVLMTNGISGADHGFDNPS
jgi:hypothetical protein